LNPDLSIETEKLTRSWARHEPEWLRDYLVAGVEDPRLNLQSIWSRHFLIRSLTGERFAALMDQEHRFAAVMDWLMRVARLEQDLESRAATLHALRQGSDNAEGLVIPRFVLRTFASLPAEAAGCPVPNYIQAFLGHDQEDDAQRTASEGVLNTFAAAWRQALEREIPSSTPAGAPRVSVLEPACGSANDYRFLDRFGVARLIDYTGIDLCERNIANARARFPGIRFETGNVFEISAPDRAFDFLFVHDLFEHLSLAGLQAAVGEVCRVTRLGLCAGFFQMDEIPEHVVRPLEEYHWNLLSASRVGELFAGHGFVGQAVHVGSFLERRLGCPPTHNPNAYTLFLTRQP
jgi:SAM-dependent methyltransferase